MLRESEIFAEFIAGVKPEKQKMAELFNPQKKIKIKSNYSFIKYFKQ